MQVYNKDDNIIHAEEADSFKELIENASDLLDGGLDPHKIVISRLPKINDKVVINGLRFVVTKVMTRSRFVIKLEGIRKDDDSSVDTSRTDGKD